MSKEYKNGKRITEGIVKNLQGIKARVELGKASLIIIDGQQGEGKSTLAVHCADEYQGEEIDLSIQYAIGGEEFVKKLQACFEQKKKVLIYDEAGDFSSRSSLTKFNRNLSRVFETFRRFKLLLILVLPNIKSLDRKLFDDGIPRMLFHCFGRTRTFGRVKGYDGVKIQRMVARMKKIEVPQLVFNDIRIKQNINAYFKDLPPHRAKELDELSLKGKIDILKEITKDSKELDGLLTFDIISEKLDLHYTTIRKRIKELNIQPVKMEGQRKYFAPEIIKFLI